MKKILFYEDFSNFSVEKFPSDYFATQEYHFLPPEGYKGIWYESTISYKWRPCNAAWQIIEDEGKKKLLSTLDNSVPYERLLVCGQNLWRNYTIYIKFSILNKNGKAGIVFRYQNSREYYSVTIKNADLLVCEKRNHEENILLFQLKVEQQDEYILKINVIDERIKVVFNNRNYLIEDNTFRNGKIGIIATTTALFEEIKAETEENDYNFYVSQLKKEEKVLLELKEVLPKPVLWKKINTKGFGTGRQIRFGHLKNKDKLDILLAQNLKLQPEKDEYSTIRCLTAIDLDGNILWQIGEPSNQLEAGIATCDLPVQIYDIDSDGNDEVIFAKNFKLYIVDGETGKIKKSRELPKNPEDENRFGYVIPDAIIIANFRGKNSPQDIIIKNRYHQIWVFDNELNFLWSKKRPDGKYPGNTGHFPVPCDVNNDGYDELFMGYTLFDCEGNIIWNHDLSDHTDEIIIGKFNPDYENEQIATASGDEGFIIFDALTGKILYKELLGHAQRITAARFREDLKGVQFYIITYWHHSGIISFHDCTGKRLFSFEPTCLGNILNPVNWTGIGTEFALLNTNPINGGLIDGYGRILVTFPNDGHPDLCCEAIDITGDKRSEIVTWDMNSIWIYTQDRDFKEKMIYSPIRAVHYNNSNYRGEYSFPNWEKFEK